MQCQRRYFAIPITSLNAGGGSGEQRGPRMRGSARSPLFAVEDVRRGRGGGGLSGGGGGGGGERTIWPGSLLLRLVSFSRDCADA